MFNLIPFSFAIFMSSIDAIVLTGLKEYSLGNYFPFMIPMAMIVYSMQPLLFLKSLNYESMTVMNVLQDITSNVIVSLIGLLYFKESLTLHKKIGLVFAFIGIAFMSYEGKLKNN